MFAAERRRKIKDILLEYRHIDINTLCSLLSVSLATVRRDLDALEGEGFLVKAHGGALLNEAPGDAPEIALNIGTDALVREKRVIGATAAQLVHEGDAVFLGAGSTCLCLAKQLIARRDIIIVTNSLSIAAETAAAPGLSTVLLGGDIALAGGMLHTEGMYAERNIGHMNIDRAFLSAQGATIEAGYTLSDRGLSAIDLLVMERAVETVMLMDYAKFGRRTLVPLAPLDRFGKVVSNVQLGDVYKEYFLDHGVKLFTAIE